MKALNSAGLAAAVATMLVGFATPAQAQSDAAIRQKIIKESIAYYPGNCPCPYNTDRAGRRCGGRSAWSRPGGHAPKCYAGDVTAAEVKAYRAGR